MASRRAPGPAGLQHRHLLAALKSAAVAAVAAFLFAVPASADTTQVRARFGATFDTPAQFRVLESPFKGMYLVVDPAAPVKQTPLLVDAGVTLLFDGQWHRVAGRNRLSDVSAEDALVLRRQLAQRIDPAKFVAIRYGKGRRVVIVNQAVDCGWCRRLERNLEDASLDLDATFYFIPGAVNPNDAAKMALAESIYCAKDRSAAWQEWMLRQARPATIACHEYSYALHTAVADVLFQGRGTPAALLEDGRIIAPGAASSDALKEVFGPVETAKPGPTPAPMRHAALRALH